jgi:hypothetical protein
MPPTRHRVPKASSRSTARTNPCATSRLATCERASGPPPPSIGDVLALSARAAVYLALGIPPADALDVARAQAAAAAYRARGPLVRRHTGMLGACAGGARANGV